MKADKTEAEIILDSVIAGERVTCFKVTFPRIVNAELLRHRCFSFSSASSRAIPVNRINEQYVNFTPDKWRIHQPGMQPDEQTELTPEEFRDVNNFYRNMADVSKLSASYLHEKYKIAKEQVNRFTEPYAYITLILQGSEAGFRNFFKLRYHPSAQWEIRELATQMKEQYELNSPEVRIIHLPFIHIINWNRDELKKILQISAARCARVSYYNFDGKETTYEEDLALTQKLSSSDPKHLSPFEFPVIKRELAEDIFREKDPDFWKEKIKEERFVSRVGLPPTGIEIKKDLSGNLHNWKLIQLRNLIL